MLPRINGTRLLGAGTALPGLVSAHLGARTVTLTDQADPPQILANCQHNVALNPGAENPAVVVEPLPWGDYTSATLQRLAREPPDLMIGADCLYDAAEFENLISTVTYLLDHRPEARFLTVYQNRR
ncbi:Methyltransferase-like protein 23 [Tieghemiomyces parasiticus]|uniref:Methyltransferase-like protein 23 n=1 Tax=Tieghemiomyces parasiticus TaxID=78921 RepID=A0A9W8A336_9FUNG|nr:Methyltransferase-like protein 23 [Tieghemiomyces parasiticus]